MNPPRPYDRAELEQEDRAELEQALDEVRRVVSRMTYVAFLLGAQRAHSDSFERELRCSRYLDEDGLGPGQKRDLVSGEVVFSSEWLS